MRQIAKTLLRPLPDEGKPIKAGLHWVLMQKELFIRRVGHRLTGTVLPDPRHTYHINPRLIEFATCLNNGSPDWEDWVLPQRGTIRPIKDGDWDVLRHRVADMRIVRAVRERIHDGIPWTSTDFYQVAVRQIESGRPLWSCTKATDFGRHCDRIDRLIESITRNGFKTYSNDLATPHYDTASGQSEILINLSRDGLPLFQDGRHRIAIALALETKQVPIQVLVRHTQWQALRMKLLGSSDRSASTASQAVPMLEGNLHFDLVDVQHSKSSS